MNATAPSPSIRLRITDVDGRDIVGAKLGERIYLRVEIDDDSEFRGSERIGQLKTVQLGAHLLAYFRLNWRPVQIWT